jgi:2-dehydropantoate 2-reductase
MRVVVMGAGGIGGFLAVRLAAASTAEVAVVARGAHLDAIRRDGLALESAKGDATARIDASEDAAALGPADLVVFAVKGYDNATAVDAIAPLMGPQTRVLSVQNGLAGVDLLVERFGAARVLAGVTYVPAVIAGPGRIKHTGPVDRFVFGALEPAGQPAVDALAGAGRDAGLQMEPVDDPLVHCWHKFVMLAPFHIVATLTRQPLGGWIDVPECRDLYVQGMAEAAAVARARGVAVADDIVETNLRFTLEVADRGTRASMLEDLERGRRLELETLAGALHRDGQRLGVPTPAISAGYALLKPYARDLA